MSNLNKIYKAFEKSEFKEIFLGNNEYFISEPTYRESHDLILVFFHLYKWYNSQTNKDKAIALIKKTIENIISNNSEIAPFEKTLKSMIIVLCYCIEASSQKKWIISKSFLTVELSKMISKYNRQDIKFLNIESYWYRIRKFLPEIPKI